MSLKVRVGAGIGLFLFLAFWVGSILLGPYCFAYDINHWVPFLTKSTTFVPVSMWSLPILIGGVLLGEVAVPLALLTWVLVACGVMA